MSSLNTDYYQEHAGTFFADTVGVDMTPLYRRFLPLLPDRGHILDAGCGSGRDARAFADVGHRVTAFDASPALAALAESHLARPVQCRRLQDVAWREAFDGVWACASLLHVPAAELVDVLRRLCCALRPGGVLYASFKYGSGEREHHGRRFTDLDELGLAELLRQVPGLAEVETWTTGDLRPGREAERWLNTLLRRTE
jgi:SAM-dependent methyltransferase